MDSASSARKWLICTALSYLGKPYVWGGDDPSGFDCSGYVVECLKSAGIIENKLDLTSNDLWNLLKQKQIENPVRGALLFRFSQDRIAVHVSICLDSLFEIGATGGDATIINPETAWRKNAFIKIRPIGELSSVRKVVYPF